MTIGDRTWRIHCGNGHAAEHATLWSDDGLAIVGDQILPGISSNLSVHPSEPEADLVSEWIDSCRK
ncbi:MAG: MBL fold metallo-hydrolase, partial [Phycisphaerae bacterium]